MSNPFGQQRSSIDNKARLKNIATAEHPFRISSLPALPRCLMAIALKNTSDQNEVVGVAAITGTAVGRAVELRSAKGLTAEEATQVAMQEATKEARNCGILPDPAEVLKTVKGYFADPRNAVAGVMPQNPEYGMTLADSYEREVNLFLPTHHTDLTRQGYYVRGHLDEIRRAGDGQLYCFDRKHSKRPVSELRTAYSYQLAAYCLAAERIYNEPIHPGGYICTIPYFKADEGDPAETEDVFIHAGFKRQHIPYILDSVRALFASLRNADLTMTPGDHCSSYAYGCFGGVGGCIPQALKRGLLSP